MNRNGEVEKKVGIRHIIFEVTDTYLNKMSPLTGDTGQTSGDRLVRSINLGIISKQMIVAVPAWRLF